MEGGCEKAAGLVKEAPNEKGEDGGGSVMGQEVVEIVSSSTSPPSEKGEDGGGSEKPAGMAEELAGGIVSPPTSPPSEKEQDRGPQRNVAAQVETLEDRPALVKLHEKGSANMVVAAEKLGGQQQEDEEEEEGEGNEVPWHPSLSRDGVEDRGPQRNGFAEDRMVVDPPELIKLQGRGGFMAAGESENLVESMVVDKAQSRKREEDREPQRNVRSLFQTIACDPPRLFQLTETCRLVLRRGDITKWRVDGKTDAIVNAANKKMLGGGGVDGAIHRAAGPGLFQACKELPELEPHVRCPTGEARITRGFSLPASHVIHTVGPIYMSPERSAPLLCSAYRSTIELAEEYGIKYVAFPAISCGTYGYPYEEAVLIALRTLQETVKSIKEVHFVLFELPAWQEWLEQAKSNFTEIVKGRGIDSKKP